MSVTFNLLFIALGLWITWNACKGIATGKVSHTDTAQVAVREIHPGKFWFIVFVQLALGVPFAIYSIIRLIKIVV